MKKRISFILVCLMIFILSACGRTKTEETLRQKSTNTTNVSKKGKKESPDDEEKESPDPSALTVAASIASPANMGDWVETKRYSRADHDYHTVYLRITDIIKDPSAVDSVIQTYNQDDHVEKFQQPGQDDLEYRIIKYEVMFPENFPQTESGITFADMSFHIRTISGEDYISIDGNESSSNLSAVYDISHIPDNAKLTPGDTFSDGTALFVMQKDSDSYLIENTYYINQQAFSCYFLGK